MADHGIGEVEGESPFIENPDETFVAIAHASPRPSMGGGAVVTEDHDTPGSAYHFRRSWIKGSLKASPSQLRIMHVEGDSMAPTLLDGDTVLVDMTRCAPNPPGILCWMTAWGWWPSGSSMCRTAIASRAGDLGQRFYSPYERSAEEIHIIGRIRWFAREI